MKNLTIGLALMGTLLLSGCPKGGGGGWTSKKSWPPTRRPTSTRRCRYLQNPDKKTGAVDYQSAYT